MASTDDYAGPGVPTFGPRILPGTTATPRFRTPSTWDDLEEHAAAVGQASEWDRLEDLDRAEAEAAADDER